MNFPHSQLMQFCKRLHFTIIFRAMPKWKMNVNMPNEMQIHLNHLHVKVGLAVERPSVDSMQFQLTRSFTVSLSHMQSPC